MRGRGQSNAAEAVRAVPRKAARLLEHLRVRGAAVPTSTAPWPLHQRDDFMRRGSARLATPAPQTPGRLQMARNT